MALSMNLAEELTCPIHLEIFENPMSLKCLHNLCEKDVNEMIDEDGLLQCPVCKRVSEHSDIKRDFRMQKLIDLHHDHANRLKDKQVCELCDDEAAVGKCRQCDMYICDRCKKSHMRAPATRSHDISAISDMNAASIEKLQNVLTTMEEAMQTFDQVKTMRVDANAKTNSLFSQAVCKINDSEKQIISEVINVHEKLRQEVEKKREEQTKTFDSSIETLDTHRASFNQDMKIIKDTMSENDQRTLLNEALINDMVAQSKQSHDTFSLFIKSMEEENQELTITVLHGDETIKQLQQMRIAISDQSGHTNPQMTSNITAKNVTSDAKQSPRLAEPNPPPLAQRRYMKQPDEERKSPGIVVNPSSFSDYVSRTLQVTKLFKCNRAESGKIASIDNQIWIVCITGYIDILSYSNTDSARKVKTLWIKEKTSIRKYVEYIARAVSQASDGSVIAACYGVRHEHEHKPHKDLGLVTVTTDGVIKDVITEGRYWDAACDNQYVYGLSHNKTVTIHQYDSRGWSCIKQVELHEHYFDFSIRNNILTLSSVFMHAVDRYDLSKDTYSHLGRKGSAPGEFFRPYVACSDAHGHVLVCDCLNQRLQLCMNDNTWRVLKLSEKIEYPRHATVDHLGQLLVVTKHALFKLT